MEVELEEADIRAMVSMLGKALSGDDGFASKRARVLEGTAQLINANSWVWARIGVGSVNAIDTANANLEPTVWVKEDEIDQPFPTHIDVDHCPDMNVLVAPIFDTLNRDAEINEWQQDCHFYPLEVAYRAGVSPPTEKSAMGPIITSQRQTGHDRFGGIIFMRPDGYDGFSLRESKIANIILSEIEWLHEDSWRLSNDDAMASLPARFSGVVDLLLNGYQRKEIADKRGLSIHTVSDYIKAIYKHFEVHSQAELMHRFSRGEGGRCQLRYYGSNAK